MKKISTFIQSNRSFILLGIASLLAYNAFSQDEIEFKRHGDRKMSGISILKKMNDVSIIQSSILFQNVTRRNIIRSEKNALGLAAKSGGNQMTATLTAYLVFSDGEPNDAEYQQVTDDFYRYLVKKLSEAGINTVPWDKFQATKYYTGLKGENENDKNSQEMTKKGNAWKIFTANNGPRPIRYNPTNHHYNAMGVGGTMKLANYGKEVNADGLLGFNIIVDFADIYLEGDAHSGTSKRAFSTVTWKKSTVKYDLFPNVRVTGRHNGGNQIFVFPVSSKAFEETYSTTDVRTSAELKSTVSQDESKIQKRGFLASLPSTAQKHEITPFVVETTKADYFNGVKNVLQKYADAYVASLKSIRN